MKMATNGIDLAKSVFQVHGVDSKGKTVLKKRLKRDQMADFFIALPPCLIGLEARGSAHHWARKLMSFGHAVRLMAPQFVKPYVKSNKNDVADAEASVKQLAGPICALCQSSRWSSRRFCPCTGYVRDSSRPVLLRPTRSGGLLNELGLILPQGIGHISRRVPILLDELGDDIPASFKQLIERLLDHFKELDRQVQEIGLQI